MATLNGIFISPRAAEPMSPLTQALLVPEKGIQGDRYFAGIGSFSRWPGSGRHVTLIEQEVIDAVLGEHGVDLNAGQSRRNLVTQGIRLADLNGQFFRIGGALLHGSRECAPCQHLERLVPGSFEALKRRGGLRAEIMGQGTIHIGDTIIPGRE
jgi:MOSC domain-containing protein YiiM